MQKEMNALYKLLEKSHAKEVEASQVPEKMEKQIKLLYDLLKKSTAKESGAVQVPEPEKKEAEKPVKKE